MKTPADDESANKSQVFRLATEQARAVKRMSKTLKASQAQIIRWAIDALLKKVDQSGGKLTLPFDLGPDSAVMQEPEAEFKVKEKKKEKGE